MAKNRNRSLHQLEDQLLSEEKSPRVYNNDRMDVDMEQFSQDVCEPPKKRSCLGVLIVLLLAATAAFLYLAWGGNLPWK